jgi:hypothetical protein
MPAVIFMSLSRRVNLALLSFNYVIYVSAEETSSAKKLRSDATFAEVNPVWFGHRYVPVPDKQGCGFYVFSARYGHFYLW